MYHTNFTAWHSTVNTSFHIKMLIFCSICSFSWLWKSWHSYAYSTCSSIGQEGAVGIATTYGLDGSGKSFSEGEVFRALPSRPWGPPSLLQKGVPVISRGKVSGEWPRPPTFTMPEVKGARLYLNSPSAPPWKVVVWILALDYTVPLCISQ
jgi:hypothetical protein